MALFTDYIINTFQSGEKLLQSRQTQSIFMIFAQRRIIQMFCVCLGALEKFNKLTYSHIFPQAHPRLLKETGNISTVLF